MEFKEDGPPPPKMTEEEIESHFIGVILVQQYNLNQGMKLFGARAEEAVEKELRQINDLETYIPKVASELTWEGNGRRWNLCCLSPRNGMGALRPGKSGMVANSARTMDTTRLTDRRRL